MIVQYHTAAEALEAATAALAAKDARIAELEGQVASCCTDHAALTERAVTAENQRDEFARVALGNAEVVAVREAELATAQADCALWMGREAEQRDSAMHERIHREQAEAELATVQAEAEKWRSAASVLCGAHIGVPRTTCPVCELAKVLEISQARGRMLNDYRALPILLMNALPAMYTSETVVEAVTDIIKDRDDTKAELATLRGALQAENARLRGALKDARECLRPNTRPGAPNYRPMSVHDALDRIDAALAATPPRRMPEGEPTRAELLADLAEAMAQPPDPRGWREQLRAELDTPDATEGK
jgi:hypothetical protein